MADLKDVQTVTRISFGEIEDKSPLEKRFYDALSKKGVPASTKLRHMFAETLRAIDNPNRVIEKVYEVEPKQHQQNAFFNSNAPDRQQGTPHETPISERKEGQHNPPTHRLFGR